MRSFQCAICSGPLDSGMSAYPHPVCSRCAGRAVLADGSSPAWDSASDSGDNPVFIGEHRCWRRYLPDGVVTLCDPWDAEDLADFYLLAEGAYPNEVLARGHFERLLREPPAAVMLGLDAQELAHNRALDAILNSEAGADFLRLLAGPVAGVAAAQDAPFADDWAAVAKAETLRVRGRYQPVVGEGRGDEIVTVTADGVTCEIVIELKIEGEPDGEQLRRYLQGQRAGTTGPVLGILLVIGERPMEVDRDGLVHVGARELIRALACCVDPRTPARLRRAVNDYRRAATFLLLRDRLIVGDKLGEDWRTGRLSGSIKAWADTERNWRWIHRRIGQEVRRELTNPLPAFARRVSLNDDPYGTAIDVWLRDADFGMPPAGRLFVKWRLQHGVGVHVGAWDGPLPEAKAILQATRERFRGPLTEALAGLGHLKAGNKGGRSGAIVIVKSDELATLDPERVIIGLREVTEAVVRALASA